MAVPQLCLRLAPEFQILLSHFEILVLYHFNDTVRKRSSTFYPMYIHKGSRSMAKLRACCSSAMTDQGLISVLQSALFTFFLFNTILHSHQWLYILSKKERVITMRLQFTPDSECSSVRAYSLTMEKFFASVVFETHLLLPGPHSFSHNIYHLVLNTVSFNLYHIIHSQTL